MKWVVSTVLLWSHLYLAGHFQRIVKEAVLFWLYQLSCEAPKGSFLSFMLFNTFNCENPNWDVIKKLMLHSSVSALYLTQVGWWTFWTGAWTQQWVGMRPECLTLFIINVIFGAEIPHLGPQAAEASTLAFGACLELYLHESLSFHLFS